MDRRASRIALQENLSGHKHKVSTLDVLLESMNTDETAASLEQQRVVANHRRLSTLYGSVPTVKSIVQRDAAMSADTPQQIVSAMDKAVELYATRTAAAVSSSPGTQPQSGRRPQTASAVDRLRHLSCNRKQNPSEPVVSRLSRPKSAVAKFRERPKDEVKALQQNPHPDNDAGAWFFGYNNASGVPAGNPFALSSRFGFRGASNLLKQSSDRCAKLGIDHPKDIDLTAVVNEWGPTLRCQVSSTSNNVNTPKMWPQSAEFPAGAATKRDTTTTWFNRETTLGATQRPKSAGVGDRLERTLQKEKAQLIALKNTADRERLTLAIEALKARPMSAAHSRKRRGSGALMTSEKRKELRELTGVSSQRRMGEMTATVKADMRPEYAKMVLDKHHKMQALHSEMKWLLLREFYKTFKRKMKLTSATAGGGFVGLEDLHELCLFFTRTSCENPVPTLLSRDQFLGALTKKILDEGFDSRRAQKLFTTFDQKNKGMIFWVNFVASIRVLLRSSESPVAKAVGIFEVFRDYSGEKMTIKNCHSVFYVVAANDEETHVLSMHYRHAFSNFLRELLRVKHKTFINLDPNAQPMEYKEVDVDVFAETCESCNELMAVFDRMVKERCKQAESGGVGA